MPEKDGETSIDLARLRRLRKTSFPAGRLFANAIGVSPITVARWESGEREPSLATLVKIAMALGTSVAYLLGEDAETTRYEFTITPYSDALDYARANYAKMTWRQRKEIFRLAKDALSSLMGPMHSSEDDAFLGRYQILHDEMALCRKRGEAFLDGEKGFKCELRTIAFACDRAAIDGKKAAEDQKRFAKELIQHLIYELFADMLELHPDIWYRLSDSLDDMDL